MKNVMKTSIRLLSIILIPILFSCATTQQKQVESDDANFYYNRGTEYSKKGQYDQAISDFNKALEINPRYAEVYNNRGIAYDKKGQYDQAISDFNKALEINPKFAEAYYNRGNVYGKKGQYDQAISDFNKALEINPRHAETYNNRGLAYYFKKEYEKSWKDIEKAQSLGYQIHPEFLDKLRKASGVKVQTEVKSKDETLLEDYRVIQRIKIPAKYLLSPGDFFRCLTFSPDGKRLAYIWKGVSIGGGSCSAWIDDNKVSPDFDFIWEDIAFCSNGSKVAYSAPGSLNNMYVWVNNNKISPEFRHTLDVAFSPDCSKVAYRAITHRDYDPNKGWGKNSIWINSTRLSPEGSEAYSEKPLFSLDGSKVAYRGKVGKNSSVWINDKKVSPEFELIESVILSPDGSSVAYTVRHDKIPSIWINEKRQFDNAYDPVFSPDGTKIAYFKVEGGKWSVYINDKKVSPELRFASNLAISPDGSKVAYCAKVDNKRSVWINDKKVSPEFAADFVWDLVFSPDSSRVAYRVSYLGKHESIWINDQRISPELRRINFAKEHFNREGEVIFAGLNLEKQEILHAIAGRKR